jgi:hypothetical protein
MARIRTIKPSFWDKDECANVSPSALLLYIGMKNFADDRGVIPGNSKLIKSKVFPQKDDIRIDQVNKWITELLENSFLVQLTFEDKLYYVLDFSDEKIDKPQPSILPDEAFENIREYSRIVETDQEDSKSVETIRLGEERKGEERKRKGKEFVPPSLDDFKNYFSSNGFPEDLAVRAWTGYSEADWHDSKGNKVLNWKQKCQNVWFSEENQKEKSCAKKEKGKLEKLKDQHGRITEANKQRYSAGQSGSIAFPDAF